MYSRLDDNRDQVYSSNDMSRRSGYAPLGANAEIGEMISSLNKKNANLERLLNKIGSSGDTPEFRQSLTKARLEGKDLCKRIFEAIKAAQLSGRADPEQASVVKKLSKQFEAAGTKYKQIAEEIERKEQVIVDVMSHSVQGRSSALEDDPSYSGGRMPAAGYGGQQYQSQEQEQDLYSRQQLDEVKRRAEGIRQIERDVNELGEMFVDLQSLVVQQGESLDLIENNVSNAKEETVAATEQLLQAEKYQKTARKRQCCLLFLVLAIVTAVVLGGVFIFKK